MTIETQDDVVALQRIGRIVAQVLQQMLDAAEPGMHGRPGYAHGRASRLPVLIPGVSESM